MTDSQAIPPDSSPIADEAVVDAHPPGSLGRMIRNSGFNAVGTVLNMVLSFVAVFVLARRLGTELLGLYFTLFTVALVVYFVLESGITTVLTRRIARDPSDLRRHVSEATGLLVIVSILSIIVMTTLGVGWRAWDEWLGKASPDQGSTLAELPLVPMFALAGIACAARLVLEFYSAVFRGLELFEYENLARVIQAALFAGLTLAFVFPPEGGALYIAVGILVVSNAAAAAFIMAALHWGWRCIGFRLNRQTLAEWLPESLPLGVGDLIQRITWQVDTILLGQLRPWAEVGIYSIAYRPLQPLNLVPRTVLSVTFPQFARLADENREALSLAFARSIRLLWIVSLPISVAVCIAAEPLVLTSAGPQFIEAVTPLRLLIWIVNLSFISTQFRFLFTALGKQMVFARLVWPILVLKILVELALIPFWGYYGACAGSFLGEATLVGMGLWACRKLGLRSGLEWGRMARAIPAGAIMAAVLWPARDLYWPILGVATGAATLFYFGLCALTGAVERQEMAQFVTTARSLLAARRAKRAAKLLATSNQAPAQ